MKRQEVRPKRKSAVTIIFNGWLVVEVYSKFCTWVFE